MAVAPFPIEVDAREARTGSVDRRLGARLAVFAGFSAAFTLAAVPAVVAVLLFTRPDLFFSN